MRCNGFVGLPERALCRAHQSRLGCTYHGTAGAAAADEATGTAVGAGAHDGAGAPWGAHDGAPWAWGAHDGAP